MNALIAWLKYLIGKRIVHTGLGVIVGLIIGGGSVGLAWRHAEHKEQAAKPQPFELPLSIAVKTWWINTAESKPPGSIASVLVFARGVDIMRNEASGSVALTMHIIDEVTIVSSTTDVSAEPDQVTIKCHEMKDESKVRVFRFRRAEKGKAKFTEVNSDGSESEPLKLLDGSMAFY